MTPGVEPRTDVPALDRELEATVGWLKEIEYLLSPCDREQAYLAWLCVMRALRDTVAPATAMTLGDHLPLSLRGAFLGGLMLDAKPGPSPTAEAFVGSVAQALPRTFPWPADLVVRAVLESLTDTLPSAASQQFQDLGPPALRSYWPASG